MKHDLKINAIANEYKSVLTTTQLNTLKRKLHDTLDPVIDQHNEHKKRKLNEAEKKRKQELANKFLPFLIKIGYEPKDCENIVYSVDMPSECPEEYGTIGYDNIEEKYPGRFSIKLEVKDPKSDVTIALETSFSYKIRASYEEYVIYAEVPSDVCTSVNVRCNTSDYTMEKMKVMIQLYLFLISVVKQHLNCNQTVCINMFNQFMLLKLFCGHYYGEECDDDPDRTYPFDDPDELEYIKDYYVDKQYEGILYKPQNLPKNNMIPILESEFGKQFVITLLK